MFLRMIEQFSQLGGLRLVVSTAAAFFVFLFDYQELVTKAKKGVFSVLLCFASDHYFGYLQRQINPMIQPCEKGCFTVAICVSMAGVRGKRRLLSGGPGFLTISGIVLQSFYHFGTAIAISSIIAVVVCGIESELFAHRREFPLVIFVVDLGHGAGCYCIGSSLLRKESGRVFVVPLQLDSFVPARDIGILRIM